MGRKNLGIEWFCFTEYLLKKSVPKKIEAELRSIIKLLELPKNISNKLGEELMQIYFSQDDAENYLYNLVPESKGIIDKLNEGREQIDKVVWDQWSDVRRQAIMEFKAPKVSISRNKLTRLSNLKVLRGTKEDWFKRKEETDQCIEKLASHIEKQESELKALRIELGQAEDDNFYFPFGYDGKGLSIGTLSLLKGLTMALSNNRAALINTAPDEDFTSVSDLESLERVLKSMRVVKLKNEKRKTRS
jgi:hypothetical protein